MYSEVVVNWMLKAVAMNKGLIINTTIVISDRLFVGELFLGCMTKSACKCYVLWELDNISYEG